MEMLEYYLLVNIYILFFWLFYHLILKNETAFQQLRIYLIGSIFASTLLPFLHFNTQSLSFIYSQIPPDLVITKNTIIPVEISMQSASINSNIDYRLIMCYLIVLGYILFIMINLIKHLKILYLINNTESIKYRNLNIKITTKQIIPLLYNKTIIIPKTISKEEMNIIVEHEYMHFQFGHNIDNLLLQAFQILFWTNPFIYLLMRDIKQIHEYQVDNEIIKSGIDASIYKLTLIKYSVGFQKFAVANGLSNSKIKNRIIMMDKLNVLKWKWKFTLFIPAFFVVFLILSFTTSENDSLSNSFVPQSLSSSKIEITTISDEEIKSNNNIDYIFVMMNRNSQLLLNGKERCSIDDISEKVTASFQQKTTNSHKQLNSNTLNISSPMVRFVILKSVKTNQNDYDQLIGNISSSILRLQDIYSNKLFGKTYNLLGSSDKEVLNNLIQPKFYTLPDKRF